MSREFAQVHLSWHPWSCLEHSNRIRHHQVKIIRHPQTLIEHLPSAAFSLWKAMGGMQAISATSWQLASHLIKVLLQKRQMVTMRLPVAERKFTLFTRFLPPHQGHPCSFLLLVHKRFGVVAMLHVSKLQLDILWHGENYCFRFWQGPLCHIMRKYFETRVDVLLVVVSICRVGLIKCQSLTCS